MKMKLTLDGIKDKKSWEAAGVVLPSYDIEKSKRRNKENPQLGYISESEIFSVSSLVESQIL